MCNTYRFTFIKMIAQVVRTTKAVQIILNSFTYKKDYFRNNKSYWKCLINTCPARITTNLIPNDAATTDVIKLTGQHNHEPKQRHNWEDVLLELLNTHQMVKPCIIINKLHSRCNDLPNETTIRSRIQYFRKKNWVLLMLLKQISRS